METNVYLKSCIVFMGIILAACVGGIPLESMPQQPIPNESLMSQDINIKGKKYNSIMTYDKKSGIIIIDFFDSDNKPAKILRSKTVNAKLTLNDSEYEMIVFKNPSVKSYLTGSRRAKRQWRLKPKGEVIYAKDERIKNISEFSLTVPLMIYGKRYYLYYVFHENQRQLDTRSM